MIATPETPSEVVFRLAQEYGIFPLVLAGGFPDGTIFSVESRPLKGLEHILPGPKCTYRVAMTFSGKKTYVSNEVILAKATLAAAGLRKLAKHRLN